MFRSTPLRFRRSGTLGGVERSPSLERDTGGERLGVLDNPSSSPRTYNHMPIQNENKYGGANHFQNKRVGGTHQHERRGRNHSKRRDDTINKKAPERNFKNVDLKIVVK